MVVLYVLWFTLFPAEFYKSVVIRNIGFVWVMMIFEFKLSLPHNYSSRVVNSEVHCRNSIKALSLENKISNCECVLVEILQICHQTKIS